MVDQILADVAGAHVATDNLLIYKKEKHETF